MTVAGPPNWIKVIGDLLIGVGAVTGAIMGVVNHYGIREVKAQTNGLVERRGRKDARAAGRQDQKDDDQKIA